MPNLATHSPEPPLTLAQIFDPTLLNGKPFDSSNPDFGPVYPRLERLDKYRRKAANGEETEEDKRAYGRAVGEAVRRLNTPRSRWCWKVDMHYDGIAAHAAAMRRDWASAVAADRARRTDAEIIAAYETAMAEKRERIAAMVAAPIAPPSPQADAPTAPLRTTPPAIRDDLAALDDDGCPDPNYLRQLGAAPSPPKRPTASAIAAPVGYMASRAATKAASAPRKRRERPAPPAPERRFAVTGRHGIQWRTLRAGAALSTRAEAAL